MSGGTHQVTLPRPAFKPRLGSALLSRGIVTTWLSLIVLIPAILLVTTGVLQSGFGITAPNDALDAVFQRYAALKLIIHTLVLLGGLGAAFILNLLPAARLQWSRDSQSLSATITLKNNLLHWALVGISLLLLATILLYSVVENFQIIAR